MFNFIFDSSIGNMLAPVKSAVCQFHLAIQHHKVDEVNAAVQSGAVPLGDVRDAGVADVHVACRYSNRYALELLIDRGVPKDLQDKYGNTCVHYCSKYGHLDLCRWLIELGCSPVTRNISGQTPYDVAENHLIRQYLLPLQFQAERDSNGKEYIGAGGPSTRAPAVPVESSPLYEAANSLMAPRPAYPGYMAGSAPHSHSASSSPMPPFPGAPHPHVAGGVPTSRSAESLVSPAAHVSPPVAAPPRPPIAGGVVVNKVQANRIPTNKSSPVADDASGSAVSAPPAMSIPPLKDDSSPAPFLPPQHVAAPPTSAPAWTPPPGAYKPPTASTSKRVITADGFGSSASDPALQMKYGNVKEIQSTAPPPTFGPPGMMAAPPQGDVAPFPGGNYAHPASHNPYSMPNPYSLPTPSTVPRPLGSSSNHSSNNSLPGAQPDVFNPKTDVNISVEASSSSSAVL